MKTYNVIMYNENSLSLKLTQENVRVLFSEKFKVTISRSAMSDILPRRVEMGTT